MPLGTLLSPPALLKFLVVFLAGPKFRITSKRTLSSHKMTYNGKKSTGDVSIRVLKISLLTFRLTCPISKNKQILFPCKANPFLL